MSRPTRARATRAARTLAVTGGLTGLLLCAAGPATADPVPRPSPVTAAPTVPSPADVAQARADLARRQDAAASAAKAYAEATTRLETARRDSALANEQYNAAKLRLDASVRAAAGAEAKAKAAAARLARENANLGQVAAHTYEASGRLVDLEVLLGPGGPRAAIDQSVGLATLGQLQSDAVASASKDAQAAAQLRQAATRAATRRKADEKAAAAARDKATRAEQAATAAATAAKTAQESALATLAAANRTTVELERQRQDALRLAAEQAAAQQREIDALREEGKADAAARVAALGLDGAQDASPGSVSPRAKTAIDFAMAQVGEWYLWGGSGPDRWDCSGLMQGAWAQAGASLDHYSGSQWKQTDRVPLSELQPGDLVFFGSSAETIHHVGMYVGDGKMVNAPHTGAQVRVESMYWSDLLPYGGRVRA